jgi:hypothetical protein
VIRVAVMRDKTVRAALNDWRWRRRLRKWRRDDFVARAEAESMRRLGRPLAPEELERVLRWHPGDL